MAAEAEEEAFGLKREIGLWGGVSFFIGVMIGSGIFVSPQSVLASSHSVGLSLLIWGLCGLVSLAGALSYAELALVIKRSGGAYAFSLAVFGPEVAFMQMVLVVFLTAPASMAAMALACAQYVLVLAFHDGCVAVPQATAVPLAVVIILSLVVLNVLSVRLSTHVQMALGVAKMAAIGIICLGGVVRLVQGHTSELEKGFEGSNTDFGEISLAFYGGMWAYDGWQMCMNFVEEVKNPNRNIPLGAVISVLLVTVVFLLANVSYFTVMTVDELIRTPAVASSWSAVVLPGVDWLMPLCVALAVLGAVNGTLFFAGRMVYTPAREGHIPELLAMVHASRLTPAPAVIFSGILACIFLLLGNGVVSLINWFSFAAWLIHALVMVQVLYMRWAPRWRHEPRPFKCPLVFPIFTLVVSVYLVLAPLITSPDLGYMYAIVLLLASLGLYYVFVKRQVVPPGVERMTTWLQLLLQVSHESAVLVKRNKKDSETKL